MREIKHEVDFCIVGGGMAGLCAALSAARAGIKTLLMQERPVLGGNASSEIRMWICGARGENNRETGIIEEIMLENYWRNTSLSYTVWDSVLYGKAAFCENLTLLLNCVCQSCEMDNDTIKSVRGYQSTSETYHSVEAKFFADCSGDSVLAPLTGADYRMGREAKSEFNEQIPPDVADNKTMGFSCLFQIRETDSPKKYIAPSWARKITDDDLKFRAHDLSTNWWWIEMGGDTDSIHNTDTLQKELLKVAFGVWDHIKNSGLHQKAENWELDWVGFLPGKRESRRYMAPYVMTENDVLAEGKFEDTVAYGGWTMDDHFPEGFNHDGRPNIFHPAPSPFGIPYRILYSRNIKNLCFAGRNVSTTHAALSAVRVMATCSLMGQAIGTAVSMAVKNNVGLADVDIHALQQQLMYDDCYLPNIKREISDLTARARVNHEVVRNGFDRPIGENSNCFVGNMDDEIVFEFDSEEKISEVRLVFDSDLNRGYKNMPCRVLLNEKGYKVPETLLSGFDVIATDASGKETVLFSEKNNYQRLVKISVDVKAVRLTVKPTSSRDGKFRIFAADVR